MLRRNLPWVCSVVISLLLCVVIVGRANAQTTIRFVPHADLQALDPMGSTANIVRMHGYLIYDTLYGLDANFVPQPQMVKSSTASEGGKLFRFVLRDNLRWHDGQPVTADDCVASLKRWSVRDPGGQLMNRLLKEMRVIDANTFELEFNQPFPLIYELFAKVAANVPFMMPKRIAETDPSKEITEYVGSGPFKFVRGEWVPGSKVVYERFKDYAPRDEPPSSFAGGKVAKVDRVEWLILRDQQTALSALISGEVDYWEAPSLDLLPVLQKTKGVTTQVTDKIGNQGDLFFNHTIPPFDNAKARQAMFWLTDQVAYLQAINGNPDFYRTCASMFTCGTPMETTAGAEALQQGPNIEKAKALFKEAGWDFSKQIVLLDPTDEGIAHPIAVVAAQAMRGIGLKVDVQAMDWATMLKRRTSKAPADKGGWNLFPSYAGGIPLSTPIWSIVFSAACDKGPPGWPCSQELEDLRLQWAVAPSLAERKVIAAEYSRKAFAMGHHVPLGQWTKYVAFNSKVAGIVEAQDVTVFWNLMKN